LIYRADKMRFDCENYVENYNRSLECNQM